MKTQHLWLTTSVLAFAWCGAASAQTTQTAPAPQASTTPSPTPDAAPQEVVVTAERRAVNLQRSALSATVLTGSDLLKKGVTTVDQLQFMTPNFGDGEQFRPGQPLQHPRHRQGRRQQLRRLGRRDHLSRRRRQLSRLLPVRALLRHLQRSGAARTARHFRRPERHGRGGVHQRGRPQPRTATTATFKASMANYNDGGLQGADQHSDQRHSSGTPRSQQRISRQLLHHHRSPHWRSGTSPFQ